MKKDKERASLGSSLKLARTVLKISRKVLADQVGVSEDTVSRWERGKASPSDASCEKLVRALELFVATLLPQAAPAPGSSLSKLLDELARQLAGAGQPAAPAAAPARPLADRFVLVVDCSGSMAGIARLTQDALNRTVEDIRKNAASNGRLALVSVVFFGSSVSVRLRDEDVTVLPRLNYTPDMGMTALIDGVHTAFDILGDTSGSVHRTHDVSNVVIVITDGEENASQRSHVLSFPERLRKLQATDRYTVTFQVPPGHLSSAVNLGVPAGNVMEWEQTDAGVQRSAAARASGISSYYTARTSGQSSVQTFYSDLSNLKKADLSLLQDISAQVRTAEVKREEDIRPFCERNFGAPYAVGAAYYQLTKTEKAVQHYKRLMVREKGTRRFYGGDDARKVLGFPLGQTVRVVPGNHAGFDIFVQSTAPTGNRKLVRGTTVVYDAPKS